MAPPGLLDGAGKTIKLALSHLFQKKELGGMEGWWVLVSPQGHSLQFLLSPPHSHALAQGYLLLHCGQHFLPPHDVTQDSLPIGGTSPCLKL